MKAAILIFLLSIVTAAADDLYTSTVFTADETRAALVAAGIPANRLPLLAGTHYAQVNRKQVITFHALAFYRLSKRYGLNWDSRFNCFAHAWYFISDASITLSEDKWRVFPVDSYAYERPAMIPVGFIRGGPENMGKHKGHCVILMLTDEGPLWWDPRVGLIPALTPAELSTVFYPQA